MTTNVIAFGHTWPIPEGWDVVESGKLALRGDQLLFADGWVECLCGAMLPTPDVACVVRQRPAPVREAVTREANYSPDTIRCSCGAEFRDVGATSEKITRTMAELAKWQIAESGVKCPRCATAN